MSRLDALRWGVFGTASAILFFQLFAPPIVGLSDQGDFIRIIGRFGYGPEDKLTPLSDAFVKRKYVRDPAFRVPKLEQPTSEYLFTGSVVVLNKIFSRDGRLDVLLMGTVHVAVFLIVFARLLRVTQPFRAAPILWIGALVALTDVGYAAYWNSFYTEPASCIFFLLLVTESIVIYHAGNASPTSLIRWSLWAALLIAAKAQNFPLAIALAPFALLLGYRNKIRFTHYLGFGLIAAAGLMNAWTIPKPLQEADTYNQIFLAILPESSDRVGDLKALGLDADYARFSGTGAWGPGTALYDLSNRGILGQEVSPATVARFYLFHPKRMWRHAKSLLPAAFSLRPEWCGNFDRSARFPPGARSHTFILWSAFHEYLLSRAGKLILLLLLITPVFSIAVWIRMPQERWALEFLTLWSLMMLIAFAVPAYGDAWDNVKHMFLFNLMIDAGVLWLLGTIRKRQQITRM
jgi:hypothetical protein